MKATRVVSLTLCFPSIAWAIQGVFLWPQPQSVDSGQLDLNLDSAFQINGPESPVLQDAIERYTDQIKHERWLPVQVDASMPTVLNEDESQHRISVAPSTLASLEIDIVDLDADLAFDVDEAYKLDIPHDDSKATLTANTVWGALRGLETFSQLVQARPSDEVEDYVQDADTEEYEDMDGLFVPQTPIRIVDAPKFPHRGLMLDTSRNYFATRDIKRTLDAMAYNKLNVFHWHITDSQSFPLRLENSPELAQEGAYVLQGKRLVYTKKDIEEVVQYARARGIRVIPEIDMPAHTGSWGLAHNDITTCTGRHFLDPSNKWENRYAAEPTTGQLNPVKTKTYEVVNKVITEIASMFPDAYYHGGGDEPVYKCWDEDESVRNYMKTNNATHDDLLGMFLSKELEMIKNSGKTAILWEDPVTNNDLPIPKDTVLQVWVNSAQQAARKGHKVIASQADFWYLDCGHGGWTSNDTSYDEQVRPLVPTEVEDALNTHGLSDNYNPQNWGGPGGDWCSPFKTWQRVYSYDMTHNLTNEEAKNVLGGEVALWAEQSDGAGLDTRLWPRSAAAAEVLWSGRYDNDGQKRSIGDAMPRIFDWRYRLLKRGIQAEALQPLWCGQNPSMCDSKYPTQYYASRGQEKV